MEIQETLDKVSDITNVKYQVIIDETETIDVLVTAIEDLMTIYEQALEKITELNNKIQNEYEQRKEYRNDYE